MLRRIFKISNRQNKGFALASVMIVSIVMMSVLVATVTSIVSTRSALKVQKYTQLAQLAVEAGQKYAQACLAANSSVPLWSNAAPLKPNTNCDGTEFTACTDASTNTACFVTLDGNTKSTFSVPMPPVDSYGRATGVPVNGYLKLVRTSSGVAWKTYTQTYRVASTPTLASVSGGSLYSDASYYYQVFKNSGTLTVSGGSMIADVLEVGGGGSGGPAYYGGGGGAGGVLGFTGQSLVAGTYAVTVGAGGAAVSAGTGSQGGNSQFGALTVALGGGGGGGGNALSGGSGGGAQGTNNTTVAYTPGTGTAGQGNNGGTAPALNDSLTKPGGGGGGAGGVGGNASGTSSSGIGGNGGVGTAAYSSWGLATNTGQNVSGTYYYGGGGGGGSETAGNGIGGYGGGGSGGTGEAGRTTLPTSALAYTGGGGGGSNWGNPTAAYGAGGSGVVIVRYAKSQVIPPSAISGLVLSVDTGDTSSYSGSGTAWNDTSGSANNQTLVGSPTYTKDYFTLNGSTQYASSASFTNQPLGNTSRTIEAWVKPNAGYAGNNIIAMFGQDSVSPYGYGMYIQSDYSVKSEFDSSNGAVVSAAKLTPNRWYHLVSVYNGVNNSIYINGTLNNSAAYSSANTQAGGINIGQWSTNSGRFGGNIGSVKIYNRALSQTEITQNFNALARRYGFYSVVTNGLMLNLDASDVSSYPGSGATWYDTSGNGRNFSIGSGITWNGSGYFSDNAGTFTGPASNTFNMTQEHTVEMVLQTTALTTNTIIWMTGTPSLGADTRAVNVHMYYSNGSTYYDVHGCCDVTQRITYANDGAWTTAVHQMDARTRTSATPYRQFFKDNVSVMDSGAYTTATETWNLTNPVILGGGWTGNLYLVRIYNRALTDAEMLSNYTYDKNRFGF